MEQKKTETIEVVDLATEQDPQGGLTSLSAFTASQSFSALRLRSAGASGYDIWSPALSQNVSQILR